MPREGTPTRSPNRPFIAFVLLGLVVIAGAAGLAHLKFKSFLSDSVHERLQIVASTSARDFATATDLGLSIPEVANGPEILARARSHDPVIASIAVFDLQGQVVHAVGDVDGPVDARTRQAFRLASQGITDPSWSSERPGHLESGTVVTGAFGQPLGGVVVQYPTDELARQTAAMRRALLRDGAIAAGLFVLALAGVAGTFRDRGGVGDLARQRAPAIAASAGMVAAIAVLGLLTVRDFDQSLEPELNRRASLIGETIRDDVGRALSYGIPLDELVGVQEYFGLFLDEFAELDHLVLRGAGEQTLDLVGRADERSGSGFFGEEILAGSVSHSFALDPFGSVEVGVDPDYVRSRLTDLGLDIGVIVIVALVLARELALAIGTRLQESEAAARRRRQPADARLVLLVFAAAEELNKSFLPLFIESADNPTGLDANVSISLPIVAYLLTAGLAAPFAGRMVDRVGERRVFVIGVAAATLSHLGMIAATNVVQIIALRALTGVGYAIATIACMEYLLAWFAPGERARSVGVFVTAVMGGTLAGTALGGIFADRFGFDAVFGISAILVAVAGAMAVALLEPGRGRGDVGVDFTLRDVVAVVRRPSLSLLLAGVTIPMNVLAAAFLWYLVPLTLASVGSTPSAIARTLMVYYLVIVVGAGALERLGRHVDRRTLVGAGSVASGAVLLLPAVRTSAPMVLVAVLVVGVGHAAVRGPQVALAMDLAEQSAAGGDRGAILAAMRLLERVGALIGLLAIAVVAARFDLDVATGAVGVAVVVAGAVFLLAGPSVGPSVGASAGEPALGRSADA